ncbi:MAG: ferrochelatase [Leucobacter sp.]
MNLPVIWGNRNWHPYTVDSLRDAAAFGAKRVLAVVTSAYASYSGSRQYREHLAAAVAELGDVAPDIDIVRPFFNDPGFIRANLEAIEEAATGLPGGFEARTSSTSPTPFRTQCRKRQRSPAPDIVSSTRMFGPRSMPRWPNVTLAP